MTILTPTEQNTKIDRQRPVSVRMILREPLTPISSEKMIYHISLDIQRLGLSFRVGDSIGVYGQNNPNLVDAWIKALGATSQEIVTHPKTQEQLPLREFLTFRANLSRLTSSFLQRILTVAPAGPSKEKLALLFDEHQKETLGLFLKEYEPLDILKQFPPETFPCDLVCQGLSPLLPRFYSIASSPTYSPDRLDLTVSHLRYFHRGEERFGVASHFLCFLANPQETTIPVYVQPAAHFTLPKESSTPIIMIGPGTGVAPYRGFMQERLQQGSTGKHWLFFGEKHQKTHFFYSQFWQDLEKQSILRLTTAFSRDQSEKVYVQHKMLEHAQDLWDWVQEGASIFICGDAEKMAKQVEESWLTIFMQQGNLSLEEAKALLLALRKQRRYLADVY